MKIITLHQPWASLIPLGLKKFETRHWATDYRGPVLIHAAKRKVNSDGIRVWLEAQRIAGIKPADPSDPFFTYLNLPLGCIVAIANLSNCLQMYNTHPFIGAHASNSIRIDWQTPLERAVGLWQPDRYALQLDNVRKLEPIPFKSRQGKLLTAPPEIIAQVNQQLQEVA